MMMSINEGKKPPRLGPDGDIESPYDRNMRLFKEHEEIFREYLREYLVSQEIDTTTLRAIEADPKKERRLIQEMATAFSRITNNEIPAEFLADRCRAMIAIMVSSVALMATVAERQPEHVVRRHNTQRAIVEAAWDVYDPDVNDLKTLRMGRDKSQQARDLLHAEHKLEDPWKDRNLGWRERDEEVIVAFRYLEVHTPSLAERLRELTQESLYQLLRQGQGLFAVAENGDEDIRLEWERSRRNPDVKEAYRTILEHVITNKLDHLEGEARSYLFGDSREQDPTILRAKRDDIESLRLEATEAQMRESTLAIEVNQAYDLFSAIESFDRGVATSERALELLDGDEVHRLAMMRSVEDLAKIATNAIERLSAAEERPDMNIEMAALLHVPSVRVTIQEPPFTHVRDPEERARAARVKTIRRIQAKKQLYETILGMCTLITNNGVALSQRTDLRRLVDESLHPLATKLIAQAKTPVAERVEDKRRAYQSKLTGLERVERATRDVAELAAHTPREIAALADTLQSDLISRKHPEWWSVAILQYMQALIQMAENKANGIKEKLFPDPDGTRLQRALNYPALAWKGKVKEDGHPV